MKFTAHDFKLVVNAINTGYYNSYVIIIQNIRNGVLI